MVQVKVDNQIIGLKESPITAIFHQLNSKVEFMDCLEIDHIMSLQHYNKLVEIEPIVAKLWKIVFDDFKKEVTKRSVDLCPEGHQALAGRIDLTLRCMIDKKKFMWKLPETMIHPCHQVNLGDLIIIMSKPEVLKNIFNTEVKNGNDRTH